MIRWSAISIECFRIRANGFTSDQNIYGTAYRAEILLFAETALFRYAVSKQGKGPKDIKLSKADLRFGKGIFLGKLFESGESIFGTRDGTFYARTVKRLPKGERADLQLLQNLVGTPWDPKAEKPRG